MVEQTFKNWMSDKRGCSIDNEICDDGQRRQDDTDGSTDERVLRVQRLLLGDLPLAALRPIVKLQLFFQTYFVAFNNLHLPSLLC